MGETRLKWVYRQMLRRTTNQTHKLYKDYGARGIKVCNEWLNSYEAFEKWAYENGYSDNALKYSQTLDRIDNNEGYSPKNCRWVSMKIQNNNTRKNKLITYKNITKTMQQWCDEYNIPKTTFYGRLQRGWSIEKAIETPRKAHKKVV
ncbi:MAG: hypothetical protein IJ272_08225 [Clostridia bacterium]|nr:hypothetical protein [Clostridia bacterium]